MSDRPESLAARIVAEKRPSPAPPSGPEADEAFKTVNTARRQRQVMLDLRKRDGSFLGLSYAYLHSVAFHASSGIVIEFSGCRVEITGINLEPLYRGLLAHLVGSIHEGDEFDASASPGATVVTSIKTG